MMAAVEEAAVHYSNLEFNLNNGSRGSRHYHAEELLKLLTGAEAAMIVNNNAAAVYLVLAALSKRSEVVVSRGELVEIGGSFRISSIMAESGAILREVGTTNKTHAYDYESAITSETAMIMKVHQSNFKMIGFTESVAREALISIADQHSCIYYEDLGSGALFDYRKSGIGEEPNLREIIASGADLVSFSGDKLFGGPQAGIILGRKKWIDLLKKHQLARILRVDKLTLAALSETLKAYLFTPERAKLEIPAVRDLTDSKETICKKAERLICEASELNPLLELEVIEAESKVGGGTMPDVLLPSFAVKVSMEGKTAQTISEKLRNGSTALVGRLHQDAFSLDCRTISEDEISLAAQLLAVL
jgi:L-seryl-tRNA(Ser) seleniumtransferase